MWMVDSGQKVKQFNQIHANSEVTCLAQDQSHTRLFTGSTDGTVKVSLTPSVCLSVCLSSCLSICLSISLSIYLFVYMSVYLSDCQSV